MLERLTNIFSYFSGSSSVNHQEKKIETPIGQNICGLNASHIIASTIPYSTSATFKTKQFESLQSIESESTTRTYTFPGITDTEAKQTLSKQFQVGDFVIAHVTGKKGVESVDPFIVMFQRIAKFFGRSNSTADHTAVHVSIVVGIDSEKGQVLISEAMPSKKRGGLRTVDLLSHNSCILEEGMGYNYQVLRPTSTYATTAQEAAKIALRVAPKVIYSEKTVPSEVPVKKKNKWSKFSFISALKAMFKRHDTFDAEAKKRVFKGIFDEYIESITLMGGRREPRKVFCSAFGSEVFQRAAAKQAWNALIKNHPELEETLKKLQEKVNVETPNKKKYVSKWAKKIAKKYGEELGQGMEKFKIDFKSTVPQDFVDFFQRNNILQPAFKIDPPK